jgi:hypothetical protein
VEQHLDVADDAKEEQDIFAESKSLCLKLWIKTENKYNTENVV